jgi:hypothetical protein
MRVVTYDTGQIVYLVPLDEVRPLSGVFLPDLLRGVGDRYQFVQDVTDLGEAIKSGAKFQNGRIHDGQKTIFIRGLEIHSDGVLITTHQTDDTEFVFNDLSSMLASAFGFRSPINEIKKRYFSVVIVEFDALLENLINGFSEIANAFSDQLSHDAGIVSTPMLSRIAFGADPKTLPQFVNAQLIIERRTEVSYDLNRYFVSAQLKTASLTSLLEKIESDLVLGRN